MRPSRESGNSTLDAGPGRTCAGERGRIGHLGDGRDAGDRFLGKTAEGVGHGADEPPVDVDRAAAHAGDDAGRGERSAFEPGEDQVALRPDDVLDDADDVRFELFDARAFEDRVADADHARPDFRDTHLRGGGAYRSQPEECDAQEKREPAWCHQCDPVIEEKCLLVKEKWGFG